ncbi:type II secretion system protein [Vibrio breoganii]|uniref:type II secretion system protein n=1 Tax=Vibrio breoganii TaxID=553239 RepID=UPI000C828A8D|nr:type II secretion system protein [Vibrio breoganii]PMO33525.1 MSHA biogenesis protein MshA [Vibrio breoganii]
MKKQGGFTLIELVVVIVILGILAVTAAPRFLNLQSDARESSLQGLKGAMAGAGSIVYGKAAIEGLETSSTAINISDNIETLFGYPTATSAGIGAAVQGLNDDDEWEVIAGGDDSTINGTITYSFAGATSDATCTVIYRAAQDATSTPQITAATADQC